MNNRRSFFKNLLGAILGATVAPAIAATIEYVNPILCNYKGREFFKTGIVYAPYIPIIKMRAPTTENHFPVLYEKRQISPAQFNVYYDSAYSD